MISTVHQFAFRKSSVKSLFPGATRKFWGNRLEMGSGFQMLIHWGLMQIARAPRMGIQLVRLRSQEREVERQLIERTPRHDPGRAIMISSPLAVEHNTTNHSTSE